LLDRLSNQPDVEIFPQKGFAMKVARRISLLVVLVLHASAVVAQADAEAEAAAHEAFGNRFATIVQSMNLGSFDLFAAAIDKEDFLDRIYGLRLIDPKVKKQFQENFVTSLPGMIGSIVADTEGGVHATLLGFASRGNRGRAVVRYDYPGFQFNYHEYDLRLDDQGRVIIIDWTDFLEGERVTDGIGTSLVMALPSKSAVRKLVDFRNPSEREVFQLTELLKAVRDRRVDKYFAVNAELDERMKGQRIVVLSAVQLTKTVRDRRKMRTALSAMAKYFPDEPLYSLMLLDYYFPSRKYAEAMQSLLRLQERLDTDDAAMDARLSAAALVMADADSANRYADQAVEREPGLELGWWSALRARLALSQYDRAVEALQNLEQQFGHALGPEELQGQKGFEGLVASDEYRGWVATRK
jgi:tetratricopeptide (TPR) repeat protein